MKPILRNIAFVTAMLFFSTVLHAAELAIWIDDTKSTNWDGMHEAIRNLTEQLPEVINRLRIDRVRVYHFGSDGWTTGPQTFPIEQVPDRANLCRDLNRRNEARVFRAIKDYGESECRRREASRQREVDGKLLNVCESLKKALLLRPKASSSCTAMNDVFRRISVSAAGEGFHIVVSDGMETCDRSRRSVSRGHNGPRLLVLLVPSGQTLRQSPSRSEKYEETKESILRAVPWADVEAGFCGIIAEILSGGPKGRPETQPKAKEAARGGRPYNLTMRYEGDAGNRAEQSPVTVPVKEVSQ